MRLPGSLHDVTEGLDGVPGRLLDLHDGLLHDLPAGVPIGHLECRVISQPPPKRFFMMPLPRPRPGGLYKQGCDALILPESKNA